MNLKVFLKLVGGVKINEGHKNFIFGSPLIIKLVPSKLCHVKRGDEMAFYHFLCSN